MLNSLLLVFTSEIGRPLYVFGHYIAHFQDLFKLTAEPLALVNIISMFLGKVSSVFWKCWPC